MVTSYFLHFVFAQHSCRITSITGYKESQAVIGSRCPDPGEQLGRSGAFSGSVFNEYRRPWQVPLEVVGSLGTIQYQVLDQQTQDIHPMLDHCWTSIYDAGPLLNQQLASGSCFVITPESIHVYEITRETALHNESRYFVKCLQRWPYLRLMRLGGVPV